MLKLSATELDLGQLPENEVATFEVSVINEFNVPVTPSITASCGCTVPELTPATIPANGESTLCGRFDTAGKAGFQTKSIFVTYTNNGTPIRLTLKFKAIIDAKKD